ncbi:ATP-binding protein [Nonomuraea sp. NPDC049152]|uniref:ATP-binding protein n=1 Tax=Nonomuraea sp. NPDC049152 TaxID=3154350 RepID=UPI0033E1C1F4
MHIPTARFCRFTLEPAGTRRSHEWRLCENLPRPARMTIADLACSAAAWPAQQEDPVGPDDHSLVHWTLPAVTATVPEARRLLRDVLHGWQIHSDVEDTLLLIASELVSNSVEHAAPFSDQVRVTMILEDGVVRLEVGDDHPFLPPPLTDADAESETGRGLLIIKLLVAALGQFLGRVQASAGLLDVLDVVEPDTNDLSGPQRGVERHLPKGAECL